MAHTFNHVHLKSADPGKAAQWYVDMFGAKPLGEREARGARMVGVQIGGVTVNISSPRPQEVLAPGSSDPRYGLEHFGFNTDDLARDLARLKQQGAKVFETLEVGTRKIAFIEGPDKVRLELVQG